MELLDLIKKYEKKYQSKNIDDKYSALIFALQLPAICGRLEFEPTNENIKLGLYKNNSPNDKKIFKHWIKTKHSYTNGITEDIFTEIINIEDFSDKLYQLRCSLIHEGISFDIKNKILIINDDNIFNLQDIYAISVEYICENIFQAAKNYLYANPNKSKNIFIDPKNIYTFYKSVNTEIRDYWMKNKQYNTLSIVYSFLQQNKNEISSIENFFKTNPQQIYEIPDFEEKYTYITPDNKIIFKGEKFNMGNGYHINCRFNEEQYNVMKKIENDLTSILLEHYKKIK